MPEDRIRTCPVCGKQFPWTRNNRDSKTCSYECGQRSKWRDPVERFWSYVDKSGGPDACWPWTKYCLPNGYGRATWENGQDYAHRVAWIITNGPIPDDVYVCHRCDNPPCCNPKCLFPGTPTENVQDMYAKDRANPRGAPGIRNASAIVDESMVRRIRQLHEGGMTFTAIAKLSDVPISESQVSRICRRLMWSHVD